MEQMTFSEAEYQNKKRKTRREIFLDQMDKLIPREWLEKDARHYPKGENGRPPYPSSGPKWSIHAATSSKCLVMTKSAIEAWRRTEIDYINWRPSVIFLYCGKSCGHRTKVVEKSQMWLGQTYNVDGYWDNHRLSRGSLANENSINFLLVALDKSGSTLF